MFNYDKFQWLKCHWTQGNAVPAPSVTEIQRSHTSSFIERVQNHLLGAKADVQLPHL